MTCGEDADGAFVQIIDAAQASHPATYPPVRADRSRRNHKRRPHYGSGPRTHRRSPHAPKPRRHDPRRERTGARGVPHAPHSRALRSPGEMTAERTNGREERPKPTVLSRHQHAQHTGRPRVSLPTSHIPDKDRPLGVWTLADSGLYSYSPHRRAIGGCRTAAALAGHSYVKIGVGGGSAIRVRKHVYYRPRCTRID